MGDAASGHSAGEGQRGGRRSTAGSSVLTPPTGMPVLPDLDLETSFPVQRQASPSAPVEPSQPPAPPVQRTVVDPCLCGHGQGAHEHYRPGSDCGACGRVGCREYRPANSAWRRFLRGVGLSD
jgi:hypothetical protein